MALADLKHLDWPETDWVNEGGKWPSSGSVSRLSSDLATSVPYSHGLPDDTPIQAQ